MTIIITIAGLPSFLISTWYTHICPMWSAFDSDASMNSKIVFKYWKRNEAVSYSLQSMTATYMLDRLPHLASMAKLSAGRAVHASKVDLAVFLALQDFDQIHVGVVL